jgi:hypothetical protein
VAGETQSFQPLDQGLLLAHQFYLLITKRYK